MNFGFFVDGPARAKQSFRASRHRPGFTPARVKAWQADVGWAAKQAIHMVDGEFPMANPFEVSLIFKLADMRRIDIDNLSKAVLDGMNGIVWKDDDQVIDLHIRKIRPSAMPGVLVEITSLDPDFKFADATLILT